VPQWAVYRLSRQRLITDPIKHKKERGKETLKRVFAPLPARLPLLLSKEGGHMEIGYSTIFLSN
jgi:hypothetical protein